MSAQESSLSSSAYGYDIVVALSQRSLNATMKAFLDGVTQPEISVCYRYDRTKKRSVPIDYQQLLIDAKGSDPFKVAANADPETDPDIANLAGALFTFGIRARIGFPPKWDSIDRFNVVELTSNLAIVNYTLTCAEFQLVQYIPGSAYDAGQWVSESQPDDAPWEFQTTVNLGMVAVPEDQSSTLPPDVRAQTENLGGGAFSVQQLLIDLDSAALQSVPTIKGVDPTSDLYLYLQKDFVDTYFLQMKAQGKPVLGYGVLRYDEDSSSLPLTGLIFGSTPYLGTNGQPVLRPTLDQQKAASLNYLCATNHDHLPSARAFGWNWIDEGESGAFHGVVAINRNVFRDWIRAQLDRTNAVSANCIKPKVTVTTDWKGETTYHSQVSRYQAPSVSTPDVGATVLAYSYHAESDDQAGLDGDMGQEKVETWLNVDVAFSGDKITVTQHLIIYLRLQRLQTSASANVVDKTITDTFTLGVDNAGNLKLDLASSLSDDSGSLHTNGFENFFTDLNSLAGDISSWIVGFTNVAFADVPLSNVRNFVFPGGKTFVFKDAAFSNHQDLVAHITYADPT